MNGGQGEIVKPFKCNLPLSPSIKIPCVFQIIHHRDRTETMTCKTTLDNGNEVKLKATIEPYPNTKTKEDFWHSKCEVLQTGSDGGNEKYVTAARLFGDNINIMNSFIERNKYVEVRVLVPKEGGCSECPLHISEVCGYMGRCRYLDKEIKNAEKDKDCPALKYKI